MKSQIKKQIKKMTAGILLLGGASAMATETASKMSVPSLLVQYMTKDFSERKLNFLFSSKTLELDPTGDKILIDAKKLKQMASTKRDRQILQLAKSLQEIAGDSTFVQIVNSDHMTAGSQDRIGQQ